MKATIRPMNKIPGFSGEKKNAKNILRFHPAAKDVIRRAKLDQFH
jgi:hypothetical protein